MSVSKKTRGLRWFKRCLGPQRDIAKRSLQSVFSGPPGSAHYDYDDAPNVTLSSNGGLEERR